MPWFKRNNGELVLIENPITELREIMLNLTRELGHMVTREEYGKYPKLPLPNDYAYYFGSFTKIARDVWKTVEKEENVNMEENKSIVNGENIEPAETVVHAEDTEPTDAETTARDRFAGTLVDYYRTHGRFPTQSECKTVDSLPSWTTLSKYFGPKDQWHTLLPEDLRTEETEVKTEADHAVIKEKTTTITHHHLTNTSTKVEVKITLAEREEPICITFSL